MFEVQDPDADKIKKLVKRVAKDWAKKSGEVNLLGSVEKELTKLFPLILNAIAESDVDMAKRPQIKSKRISVNLTSMNSEIKKALSKRELQDGTRVENEDLATQIRKMYAHLPKKKIQEIIDCCPLLALEDYTFHYLYTGSNLCVTLPAKIKQRERYGFTKPENITNFINTTRKLRQLKREFFVTEYEEYSNRNGEEFVILKEIITKDYENDGDTLPMYVIQFKKDGAIIEAWAEEIFL